MLVLRDLAQFLILAEELSFRRAADRLEVSQPALTQTLQRLERECGTRLLERTTRHSRLTPAGEVLQRRALALLQEVESTRAEVQATGDGLAGQLRIGAVNPALRRLVPEALRPVRLRFPDLRLSVHPLASHAQVRSLREGTIDVVIIRTNRPPDGYPGVELMHEPLFASLPPGHRLAGRERLDLAELSGDELVHAPRERNPEYHDALMSTCRDHGFEPSRSVMAETMYAQLALIAAGVGIAVHTLLLVDHSRDDVVFVPVDVDFPIPVQVVRGDVRAGAAADLFTEASVRAADVMVREARAGRRAG